MIDAAIKRVAGKFVTEYCDANRYTKYFLIDCNDKCTSPN